MRFDIPYWNTALAELQGRLVNKDTSKPPVALIAGKQPSQTQIGHTPPSSPGIGKTDLTYYITEYFRREGVEVLAFPDVKQHINAGTNFYTSLFIPEVLRISQSRVGRVWQVLSIVALAIIKFMVRAVFLILRIVVRSILSLSGLLISIPTFAALLLSVLQSNLSSLQFLKVITSNPAILQIATLVLMAVWAIHIIDRIQSDKDLKLELTGSLPVFDIEARATALANRLVSAPREVARLLTRGNLATLIIVDDAEHLDSSSLASLLILAGQTRQSDVDLTAGFTPWSWVTLSQRPIGIVFLFESDTPNLDTEERREVHSILSLSLGERNNWINLSLAGIDLDELTFLLWGYYKSPQCDVLLSALRECGTETLLNTGLLLEFFYELDGDFVEKQHRRIEAIDSTKICAWYLDFVAAQNRAAAELLAPLRDQPAEPAAVEMLKYMLAFQASRAEAYIVDTLLAQAGFDKPEAAVALLVKNNLLSTEESDSGRRRYYTFGSKTAQMVLETTWVEWQREAEQYISKVFWILHKLGPTGNNDRPQLAKRVTPSRLVVDVLWREGDALWLYGGKSDTALAAAYYGFPKGALAKWLELFLEAKRDGQTANELFLWKSDAKLNPYRHIRTSKSPPAYSFIGDLVYRAADISFLAGDFQAMKQIHEVIWPEILSVALASPDVAHGTKQRLSHAQEKFAILYATQLLIGAKSPADWAHIHEICGELLRTAQAEQPRQWAKWVEARLAYISTYGLGNEYHSLTYNREPAPEVIKSLDFSLALPYDLQLVARKALHLRDYLDWALSQAALPAADVPVSSLLGELFQWKKQLSQLGREFTLTTSSDRGIDHAIVVLICHGLYFLTCAQFALQSSRHALKTAEGQNGAWRGRSIFSAGRQLFKDVWSALPLTTLSRIEVDTAWKELQTAYRDMEMGRESNLATEVDKVAEASMGLTREMAVGFLQSSLEKLELAASIASLSSVPLLLRSAEYYRLRVLVDFARLGGTSPTSISISEQLEVIYRLESQMPFSPGLDLEASRAHFFVAETVERTDLLGSASEYGKAMASLVPIRGHLPDIFYASALISHLSNLGNVAASISADRIISLAQEALTILNTIDGRNMPLSDSDLNKSKALARWWLTEGCRRLAQEDSIRIDELEEAARPHINWLRRQSDSSQELEQFAPKAHQARAHFLAMRHKFDAAIEELEPAIEYYRSHPRLLENIQTWSQKLDLEIEAVRAVLRLGKKPTPKQIEKVSSTTSVLHDFVNRAQALADKQQLDSVTLLAAARVADKLADLFADQPGSQLLSDAGRLWKFAVVAYQRNRIFGRALLILRKLKSSGAASPIDFSSLVRNSVYGWDPRVEDTDPQSIEAAISHLLRAGPVEMSDRIGGERASILADVGRILARPNPDYALAVQMIETNLPGNLPEASLVLEDLECLRLLGHCYKVTGNIAKAAVIQERLKHTSEVLGSRSFLRLANILEQEKDSNLYERFLLLAAQVATPNEYSREAVKRLGRIYGQTNPPSAKQVQSSADAFTYDRLMNLPLENFDRETCYSLLVMLETELRRLIVFSLDPLDRSWWLNRVPQEVGNMLKDRMDQVESGIQLLEYASLGDLVKIILAKPNWGDAFAKVFRTQEYLQSRATIVIPTRNDLAHSLPISQDTIYEFVITARQLLKRFRSFLPDANV